MPQKCYIKPNRTEPRRFNESDAARIVCRVVRAGGSEARIRAEYARICKDISRKRPSAAEAALELAAQNIQQNSLELDNTLVMLQALEALVSLLFALLPFLRLPGIITRVLTLGRAAQRTPPGLIAARISQVQLQRSANDQAFRIVQQASANERAFRLTGTGI